MGMESPKDERMDVDEAHEEANLLRAQMNVNPETGKITGMGFGDDGPFFIEVRNPTPEDYDKASAELEELKRAAKEDPVKLSSLIHDLIERGAQGIDLVQRVLGIYPVDLDNSDEMSEKSVLELIKQRWQGAKRGNDLFTVFEDAQNRLDFLKERAERFGEQEKL